ncbi:mycofactocin biosynthesis peptidyl-dipeptidase MftE [Streptomyces sp. NBC_00356]|uniref:mycofactocin biosynthesis peptidyl-dipeptidase MftE n=1 Tax=Streptomyces sp. NBC_00356 TaxID=2975724 RepID=UPI002E263660
MPEPVELARATWPTVPESALVLVPVGSTEQHGPHLPFHTDSTIAEAVARGVARRVARQLPYEGVVLAPTFAYGASGEHAGFPGTLSIGHEALHAVLVETVRSLSLWAGRVVLLNGHGGNVTTLDAACAQLCYEGHDVAWLGCAPPGGDAHAGRTETSVMLHLAPDDVRLSEAAPGDTRPLPELLPHLMAHGVRGVSPNGVLGDPTGATAEEGRALVEAMVSHAVRLVTAGHADPRGRLVTAVPQGAA